MDRLTEMEAFATVVDQGGFTDAARKMGISKSAVSKHVSSLEARLGARLLNRTTRMVSPTEIGLMYYDRARRVLNDAGEADALVSSMQNAPSGVLKVAADFDFGVCHVSPLLNNFLEQFPDISINLQLSDDGFDLIESGFDLSIRIGDLEDSSLKARKIASSLSCLVAAPEYLQSHPTPLHIDDLAQHKLLHRAGISNGGVWRLETHDGDKRQIKSNGGTIMNDGLSLLNACLTGVGIAYLPMYLISPALRSGRLVKILGHIPTDTQTIHAVYPPGRFVQPKVRAFIDYMVDCFSDVTPEDWRATHRNKDTLLH